MEDAKDLLKTTLEELERMLSSRTVVGEPIEIQGQTLIPLSSVGFGFGAGGGTGKSPKSEAPEGNGAGTGGGGGIKPVAVVVVSKEGVRVEPIRGATAGVVEKLGETLGRVIEKKSEKKAEAAKDH